MPATALGEFGLLAVGVLIYARTTRPADRIGRYALWVLLALLAAAWLSQFGPPPPGERAVAFGALLMWLTVAWGAWADRHRALR